MMRSMIATVASIGLMVWPCIFAFGATYHVAQKHPAASDTNLGSADRPFKTIAPATSLLKPGDVLLVHEGIYRETVEFKGEGTDWTSPIVIMAAPGEEAQIRGSDVVTDWAKHKDNIYKKDDWKINSQMVFANGRLLQQIAGEMTKMLMEHWRGREGNGLQDMRPGSFFMDTKAKTLYVWLEDGSDPNKATMEVGVRPFLMVIEGKYLVVKGFKMLHSSTSNYVNWPAFRVRGEFILVKDNEVTWTDYIGFGFHGRYIDVIGNKFNHHGNSGVGGNSLQGCRMIGNESSYNNYRRWSSGWHAGGIKMIPIERGLIIENHRAFHNIASDGIWIDSYDSGPVTINNCVSAFNEGNGIHFEIASGGFITNNLLYKNRGRGIYLSSSRETLVAHNVAYGNGMSGIVSVGVQRQGEKERFGDKGIVPARNNRIIGNIMMNNMNPALKPKGWEYRPELILPNPQNDPSLFSGCISDFNIFCRSDGRAIPFWWNWGEKTWPDLAAWQKATGCDLHSLMADPKFVDPENGDFHLRPDSPARDLVCVLGEVGFDADGKERPRKALCTAGAYELADAAARPPAVQTQPARPAEAPAPKPSANLPSGKYAPPAPVNLKFEDVPLPSSAVTDLALSPDGALAALGRALSGVEITAEGVRMVMPDPATGLLLSSDRTTYELNVGTAVKTLYFLVGAFGAKDGPLAACDIVRGDGVTQQIPLVLGRNVGPGIGRWNRSVEEKFGPPYCTTSLGWEGRLSGDQPARLFLLTYVNDNEWLPVQKIVWTLKQPEAQVLVLKVVTGKAK